MIAHFTPAVLQGRIDAPPSKSMAHRIIICAALCQGKTKIYGISESEDIKATLGCIESLGARYEKDGDTVTVEGIDIKNAPATTLNCNESGSTLRFFIPLCMMNEQKKTLCGTQKLLSRPLIVYENLCRANGFTFEKGETSVSVKGKIKAGNYRVEGNISSQFISGLLFVLPLCEGDSVISIIPPIESRSYLDLTISAMKFFGVDVKWTDDKTLYIKGGQSYRAQSEITVEGDYSNAAFFAALQLFGNEIEIDGLSPDSLQGDRAYIKYFEMLNKGTPTIYIGDCPDLGPVLMAVAAAKNGAVFCGTRRLKLKESDRAQAMAEELSSFGVSVTVQDDSVVVYPASFKKPHATLRGHNDHRIVMALSVLLSQTGGRISGISAVNKSLPEFFEMIESLGAKINYEAE